MLGEVVLGLFFLALGCLCLKPVFEESKNPKMSLYVALGVLFLLIGKAFLVMALTAMF